MQKVKKLLILSITCANKLTNNISKYDNLIIESLCLLTSDLFPVKFMICLMDVMEILIKFPHI